MDKQQEQAYLQGNRAAWNELLSLCLKNLGYEHDERTAWIVEREQAIAQLRIVCGEYGDNEWDESLHLADVIEKHLADHLEGRKEGEG